MSILTTHVGSLPGPPGFDPTIEHDAAAWHDAVAWVVAEQRAAGLDIINEGELTKQGDWLAFMDHRLGGFEERPVPAGGSIVAKGQDRETFAEFYRHAAERQTLFFTGDNRMKLVRRYTAATGPITYTGGDALAREISTLKAVTGDPSQCFLTSTAPSSRIAATSTTRRRRSSSGLWRRRCGSSTKRS